MAEIIATIQQTAPTTVAATIRNHGGIMIDRPEAKGGADAGPMGGEYLLAALGGCFSSTLLAAVRAREADVSALKIRVVGTLEGAPARFTAIELQISAAADQAQLAKLITISERACIVANTIRDSVALSFRVVGAA